MAERWEPPEDPLVDVCCCDADVSIETLSLLKKRLQTVLGDLASSCDVDFSEASQQLVVRLRNQRADQLSHATGQLKLASSASATLKYPCHQMLHLVVDGILL